MSQPPPPPGPPPPPPPPPETKSEASDLDYVTRREIGREAVWSLSSAKPGNGVDQLRDDSIETYWQSGVVGVMTCVRQGEDAMRDAHVVDKLTNMFGVDL